MKSELSEYIMHLVGVLIGVICDDEDIIKIDDYTDI